MNEETCHYCGRPAVRLCDGVVGWLSHDGRVIDTSDPAEAAATCDRPLCAACVATSSPVFFDGSHADGTRWGEVDTHDLCPGCEREGRVPGDLRAPLLSRAELAAVKTRRLEGAAPRRPALRLLAGPGLPDSV